MRISEHSGWGNGLASAGVLSFASVWLAMVLLALPPVHLTALTPKVLVIGVDGTMPQYLLQAQTPNLDALCVDGCYSFRAITHPVTHSAACWTAMFTGVWGDKNGVNDVNNGFKGTHFDLYPNFMQRLEGVNSQ